MSDRKYTKVNNNSIPFYQFDDKKNKEFKGRFIGVRNIPRVKGGVFTKLLFESEGGDKFYLPTHDDLQRAVEREGTGYYRIIYKGETATANNRKKVYDIEFSLT